MLISHYPLISSCLYLQYRHGADNLTLQVPNNMIAGSIHALKVIMKFKNTALIFIIITLLSGIGYWIYLKLTFQPTTLAPQPSIQTQPTTEKIEAHLHRATFKQLPGWETATDHQKSFMAFQLSCKTLLRQNPSSNAGTEMIPLKVKDLQPACRAALKSKNKTLNDLQSKTFFEHWFIPVTPYEKQPINGLFTGYYMPLLHGSLAKTTEYRIPIYGVPDNLLTIDLGDFDEKWANKRLSARVDGKKVIPFFTRQEINEGAIEHHAPVIAWARSAMDRLNLEIQGSGVVALPNGEELYLGYAAGNGAPYTPIGRILIDKGVLTRDSASMQSIRSYLESHPKKIDPIINQNKSFVFFKLLDEQMALGAQGVGLTDGYSLAVDRQWIPLGTPMWLNTTHPDPKQPKNQPLQRLLIAQDTGGAIKGVVRGDVYWGAGDRAEHIAGNMRNQGQYWILVPKHLPWVNSKNEPSLPLQ